MRRSLKNPLHSTLRMAHKLAATVIGATVLLFGIALIALPGTAVVLAMLAIDLGIFHHKAHAVRAKEAGAWVAVWMTLALTFTLTLLVWKGAESALLFATGYL